MPYRPSIFVARTVLMEQVIVSSKRFREMIQKEMNILKELEMEEKVDNQGKV